MKPFHLALLLATLFSIMLPASGALPGDISGNDHLEKPELSRLVLAALKDDQIVQDARDAAYVYMVWNGSPKRITDSSGKERVIRRPLYRIVVLNSETLETMRSIGYDTTPVIGVDKYILQKKEFFPEFAGTPGVGSIWAPDYEKIVSLRPDAVFLYATVSKSSGDAIEEKLAATSPEITVFRFDGYLPETYSEEIRVLSDLLDCQETGQEFLKFYTINVDAVSSRSAEIPKEDRIRVYFETWTDYKSCAAGSGYDQKITMAGGSNIFGDETAEYPEIDPEAILKRSPQVVVKLVGAGKYIFGGYEGGANASFQQVHRDIISRKGWESLPAVRDGRTYILHTDILGGPHFFIGVQYMAEWFYPERFGDLDPETVHAEYLSRFQGLNKKLNERQNFIYPV